MYDDREKRSPVPDYGNKEESNTVIKIIAVCFLLFVASVIWHHADAAEKDYQVPWCNSQDGISSGVSVTIRDSYTGKVEGYIDCLTAIHAIEVDFDYKWKEAPTQALWYAMNTGKRAGILLIVSPNGTGLKKLKDLINHYGLPIDVFMVNK